MGLFGKKVKINENFTGTVNMPDIQFGRYTDRHKTKEQLDAWDKAVKLYGEKNYLEAYNEFFIYLKDKKTDNVSFEKTFDRINFEIIQGSKIVKGYASDKEVVAESELVSFDNKPHVAVMRKLLSVNYDLFFGKFALKDNIFTLKYSAPVQDAAPLPLYYSLKEVANQSDKYDDVLADEFTFLKPINVSHIQELPESEKEVKYKFFKESIESTFLKMKDLAEQDFAGARSFLLLSLTFKLYYLLAPEGVLLDDLRYIQGVFFARNDLGTAERNYLMFQEFQKMSDKPKDDIMKSFYKTKASFAVVKPTAYKEIADFIADEIKKSDWYRNNKYFNVEQAVYDYIVAYAEFFFGMDVPVYEFFDIYWRVTNEKYFNELGFNVSYYNSETKKLNKTLIETAIQAVNAKYKADYPHLNFLVKNLNYNNLCDFSYSFLTEMIYLNLNK
jgi:hypothetical protein